jgi:hypothetical protein
VLDDAVRRVAVVDVQLSRLPRVRSRTRSHGRSRRCREGSGVKGKPPRTKMVMHRGSRRGSMPKSMQSGADGRDISGFAKPKNTSGTCERGCTTRCCCLRDQQRRPPRRSQAQNGEEKMLM